LIFVFWLFLIGGDFGVGWGEPCGGADEVFVGVRDEKFGDGIVFLALDQKVWVLSFFFPLST